MTKLKYGILVLKITSTRKSRCTLSAIYGNRFYWHYHLFYPDTNNHKIKQINPKTKEISEVDENIGWRTPYNIALDKNENLILQNFSQRNKNLQFQNPRI